MKSLKRGERRAHAWRDKAKRYNWRNVGHKLFFVEREERKAERDPVYGQVLFDLVVEEITERAAYPDERTNRGQCNIAEAVRLGVVKFVYDD